MMERRQRRYKQLLDALMETRKYWNLKRKHKIALCGKLSLEETMDPSQDRLWHERILKIVGKILSNSQPVT